MSDRKLLTIEAWDGGRKTLHYETFIDPLTDEDRAIAEAALASSGFYDFVASIEARGYTPEVARQRAAIILTTELARHAQDEAGYRRECERRGLLAL